MHGSDPPDSKRQRRRDRQRRWRKRQSDGALSVTLTVTPAETAKLERLQYLTEGELENRERVAEAIRTLLAAIVLDV